MVKLGFGLSVETLANCGINENALMLDMIEGSYIINKVLPMHLRDERSDDTSVARLFAQLDKQEQERQATREKQEQRTSKLNRLALYAQHSESVEYSTVLTIEDESRIDAAHVRCYADFVKLGILAPITYEELKEFKENQEHENELLEEFEE